MRILLLIVLIVLLLGLLACNCLKMAVFAEQIFVYIEPCLESFLHPFWIDLLLIFLTFLSCLVLLIYMAVLYDMGLLDNRELYAVSLGNSLERVVNDILELATTEEIGILRQYMYQRGYIPQHVYPELWNLADCNQVRRIIKLSRRGESQRRVMVALENGFREMATDRNRCGEIADRIARCLEEWKMVKRWFRTFKEYGQRLWREKMIKTLLLIWKKIMSFAESLIGFYFKYWSGLMVHPRINENKRKADLIRFNGRVFLHWSKGIGHLERHYLPY